MADIPLVLHRKIGRLVFSKSRVLMLLFKTQQGKGRLVMSPTMAAADESETLRRKMKVGVSVGNAQGCFHSSPEI